MKPIQSILLNFAIFSTCHAMDAGTPIADLLPETDLVVVASMSNVEGWTTPQGRHGKGVLTVSESLSGSHAKGGTVTVTWVSRAICPSVNFSDTKGEEFIWFLQKMEDGTFTANNSSRRVTLKDKESIVRFLAKHKAEQGGTGQPATRSQSESEGSDKPQPEAEGRSR
jgi:hypothetical protein